MFEDELCSLLLANSYTDKELHDLYNTSLKNAKEKIRKTQDCARRTMILSILGYFDSLGPLDEEEYESATSAESIDDMVNRLKEKLEPELIEQFKEEKTKVYNIINALLY